MPLTMAGIGETNTISRIGGNEETRRFLANLGFVAGAEVVVLSKIGGNVIVNGAAHHGLVPGCLLYYRY